MISMTYGYKVGRFFDRGFWSDTFLFLEVSGDAKTIQPIAISLPRSSGLPADRLYANMTYARIGIRKTISFSDSDTDSRRQRKTPRYEEEESTLPEPNPDLSRTNQNPPKREESKKNEPEPEDKPPSKDRPQREPPDDSYFPY